MDTLPLFFKLTGAPVLLVGGGQVAARKARLLLRAGASVTVVAPELCDELSRVAGSGGATHEPRAYRDSDLDGVQLVVAATGERALNEHIHGVATARNLPINVVDDPELCTVIFPSIVDRSPLLIAISSGGKSPVLARIVRRKLEEMLPGSMGRLAQFAGRLRDRVKAAIPNESERRLFWEQILEGAVAEQVMIGNEAEAEREVEERLTSAGNHHSGEVYLVGAGPGDPDLLTFRAARLLQTADIVLYDRLVSEPVLEMARRDAQMIYVGKRRNEHAVPQQAINQQLLTLAQQGHRVIRLKGGDPFIFGRGGEEIELLARHGIPFQVVPGVTAASGAACYAGIPLTHRDHAQSVRFVAGYLKGNKVDHDWSQFQSPSETLVFYMGLLGLPIICRELQAHGRSPDTPVGLIERATTPQQRVITGTLATMPAIIERQQPAAPTLFIVGDVVRLHSSLAWFKGADTRPE